MGIKLKDCRVCKRSFIGSIDLSGKVCSIACKMLYRPSESEINKEKKKEARERERRETENKKLAFRYINPKCKREKASKRANRKLKKSKRAVRRVSPTSNSDFYETQEWQTLRYKAIKLHGRKCMACGASGVEIHVDHIKPKSKFPELKYSLENLQILCRPCNMGKGAWDDTDWRKNV